MGLRLPKRVQSLEVGLKRRSETKRKQNPPMSRCDHSETPQKGVWAITLRSVKMDDKTLKTAKTISVFYRLVTVRRQKGYYGPAFEFEIHENLTERAAEKRLAEMNKKLRSNFYDVQSFDLTTERDRKELIAFALEYPKLKLAKTVMAAVFGERSK